MLEMTVFYIVFGLFLSLGTENYVAFLLTGLIPWTWFARSISNSMTCLSNSGWLLNHVRINPVFFPLVDLGQDFVKQGITFSFLLLFLVVYGIEIRVYWLWLPVVIFLQMLLVTSVGVFVASIIPFMSDLRFLISTLIQVLFFASGIFFSKDFISENMLFWFFINPMASLIDMYRGVLLYNEMPSQARMYIIVGWAIIFSLLSCLVIQRHKWRYARLIME